MLVETKDLEGAALDWVVAKIENPAWWEEFDMDSDPLSALNMDDDRVYAPSTDWSLAGPIIEREEIALDKFADYPNWQAECNTGDYHNRQLGPTALVAAMRCFVASRLGFEIEVPDEIATAKPVANQGLSV